MVVEANQKLFRDAVLVYEAVALQEQHHFAVERVWRGPERERVVLTWPTEHLHSCRGHQPTAPGKRYLLTIQCPEPAHGHVFACPSRAEPIEHAETRLRYLRESYPLSRQELADNLRLFTTGSLSAEKLALWIRDMTVIAEPLDWEEREGLGTVSLTLGSVQELDLLLNQSGVPLAEIECEIAFWKENVVPLLVAFLESHGPTTEEVRLVEQARDAAEVACW